MITMKRDYPDAFDSYIQPARKSPKLEGVVSHEHCDIEPKAGREQQRGPRTSSIQQDQTPQENGIVGEVLEGRKIEQEQSKPHDITRDNKCKDISATCSVYTPELLGEEPLPLQSQSEIEKSETINQQTGHQLDGPSEVDPSIALVYKCANCSFRCWLCNTAKIAENPPVEEDNMNQMPPPSTLTTSSSKTKRNDGLQYLGPKDKNFERFILAPTNIFISEEIYPSKPEDIPQGNVSDETTKSSQVFLNFDHAKAVEISTQLVHSHRRSYDEIALMKVVAKYLAPFDPYVSMEGPETVLALCRDKWQPAMKGPSVPTALGLTYDWDIVPDMSYMVSLNVLPSNLRYAITGPDMEWLCADTFGVGPYLTLEFKCSEKSGKDSDAVRQVTVASVIWLHQRKRIREALKSSDTEDLQHYSIILNSITFQVWRTTLEGTKYMIRMLDSALLSSPNGIEQYIKWWNAIHRWGLGSHAQSFKRDVEALWKMNRENASNTELVPPLTEERLQTLS